MDIRNRRRLEIVESLCPDLKSIRFSHFESEEGAQQDLISIEEIPSILSSDSKCWSKVRFFLLIKKVKTKVFGIYSLADSVCRFLLYYTKLSPGCRVGNRLTVAEAEFLQLRRH